MWEQIPRNSLNNSLRGLADEMSRQSIRFSFSLRGVAPAVTEEELSTFFASIGGVVASIRMVKNCAT